MNVTKVTAHQSDAERNKSEKYQAAVYDLDGNLVVPFVDVAAGFAEGLVTADLPGSFFEVGGKQNGQFKIGFRAVDAGGPGAISFSQIVNVVWEPVALTDVTAL